jgi:hypothetical protein
MTVAKFITDNLTTVLVIVGGALLAYYAILAVITVANFLEAASKVALLAATGGLIIGTLIVAAKFILLALGAIAVAAAFLLMIWPITLTVAAVIALVAIFKNLYKTGWDLTTIFEAVKDNLYRVFVLGFREIIIGLKSFMGRLIGYSADDEKKDREELAKDKDELDKAEIARDKKRAEKTELRKTDEDRKEEAEAKRKAEEERKRKELEKQKPGAPGGAGGMGGIGGSGAGATSSAASSIPGMDYNLGGDALLKQFAERQKGSPMAAGDATRKQLETDGMNKQQAEVAAKAEAAAKVEKEKSPQDSPTAQLAELNNKMATLLKYTYTVAHNTNENVSATRGLNNNLFKA